MPLFAIRLMAASGYCLCTASTKPAAITISPSQLGNRIRIFIFKAYVCKKIGMKLRETIEQVWQARENLTEQWAQDAVRAVIEEVDKGRLRVAEPGGAGWQVNEW